MNDRDIVWRKPFMNRNTAPKSYLANSTGRFPRGNRQETSIYCIEINNDPLQLLCQSLFWQALHFLSQKRREQYSSSPGHQKGYASVHCIKVFSVGSKLLWMDLHCNNGENNHIRDLEKYFLTFLKSSQPILNSVWCPLSFPTKGWPLEAEYLTSGSRFYSFYWQLHHLIFNHMFFSKALTKKEKGVPYCLARCYSQPTIVSRKAITCPRV